MKTATPLAPDRTPQRRCIATGQVRDKSRMIRFVLSSTGVVAPDLAGKLPGRGLWVSAERDTINRVMDGKAFARAARRAVDVPEGLCALVEAILVRRVQHTVALARKSGSAVCGYEKVRNWTQMRPVRVLLQAADGAPGGKGKLTTPQGARYFDTLTAAELGRPFGRDRAVHAVLAAGPLAESGVRECTRLAGLRPPTVAERSTTKGYEVG